MIVKTSATGLGVVLIAFLFLVLGYQAAPQGVCAQTCPEPTPTATVVPTATPVPPTPTPSPTATPTPTPVPSGTAVPLENPLVLPNAVPKYQGHAGVLFATQFPLAQEYRILGMDIDVGRAGPAGCTIRIALYADWFIDPETGLPVFLEEPGLVLWEGVVPNTVAIHTVGMDITYGPGVLWTAHGGEDCGSGDDDVYQVKAVTYCGYTAVDDFERYQSWGGGALPDPWSSGSYSGDGCGGYPVTLLVEVAPDPSPTSTPVALQVWEEAMLQWETEFARWEAAMTQWEQSVR